eukprot:TRINITY_DN1534_c0_g1_i1.p1 TRINITY_DN1534_c0_g1~~TRINITY_DN1534_c0_g1_i1.p1  ORF type:complete len:1339 (-),score=293.29 TRINITY_DN1534_c0_g1_i1:26-4042(-)
MSSDSLWQSSALSLKNTKKQGFLLTKETNLAPWRKLYIILHEDHLFYFTDDCAKKPKEVFSLGEYSKCEIFEGVKFAFKILPKEKNTRARVQSLTASSETERDAWMRSIQSTLKSIQERYRFLSSARIAQTCYCKVSEIKLVSKEPRDVFCTISIDDEQKGRTPTYWRTNHPIIDEEFEIFYNDCFDEFQLLRISLREEKKKSISYAEAIIPISNIPFNKSYESWFRMYSPIKPLIIGQVQVRSEISNNELLVQIFDGKNFNHLPQSKNFPSNPSPPSSSTLALPTSLSPPSLYLGLTYENNTKYTVVAKKSFTPIWKGQIFKFTSKNPNNSILRIEVYRTTRATIPSSGSLHINDYLGDLKDASQVGNDQIEGVCELVGVLYLSSVQLAEGKEKYFDIEGISTNIYNIAQSSSSNSGSSSSISSLPSTPTTSPSTPTLSPLAPSFKTDEINNYVMGEIKLSVQRHQAEILPDKPYEDLFRHLVTDDFNVIKSLASVSNQKEKIVAESLVKAFDCRNSMITVKMIVSLIVAEIERTNDPNVLFRGNTVATKSLDTYMRLAGMSYLQSILKPIVALIYEDSNKCCELDPTRIQNVEESKKEKVIQKNLKNLMGRCTEVLSAIYEASSRMPLNFRVLFQRIKESVLKKWGDPKKIQTTTTTTTTTTTKQQQQSQAPAVVYTAISGFIFLRFFCPALLTPKSFGILPDVNNNNPTSDTNNNHHAMIARDLTLIAKTIQNMANLVVFGKKEPFMVACNPFIEKNQQSMKDYLLSITTIPTGALSDDTPTSKNYLNWGYEMSKIHAFLVQSYPYMSGDAVLSLPQTTAAGSHQSVNVANTLVPLMHPQDLKKHLDELDKLKQDLLNSSSSNNKKKNNDKSAVQDETQRDPKTTTNNTAKAAEKVPQVKKPAFNGNLTSSSNNKRWGMKIERKEVNANFNEIGSYKKGKSIVDASTEDSIQNNNNNENHNNHNKKINTDSAELDTGNHDAENSASNAENSASNQNEDDDFNFDQFDLDLDDIDLNDDEYEDEDEDHSHSHSQDKKNSDDSDVEQKPDVNYEDVDITPPTINYHSHQEPLNLTPFHMHDELQDPFEDQSLTIDTFELDSLINEIQQEEEAIHAETAPDPILDVNQEEHIENQPYSGISELSSSTTNTPTPTTPTHTPTSTKSPTPTSTPTLSSTNLTTYIKNDDTYDNEGIVYCQGCKSALNKDIIGEYIQTTNNQYYHTDCLTCQSCQSLITGPYTIYKQETIYCQSCWKNKSQARICHKCKEPILFGPIVKGSENNDSNGHPIVYHKNCFRCVGCNTVLEPMNTYEYLDEQTQSVNAACYTCAVSHNNNIQVN